MRKLILTLALLALPVSLFGQAVAGDPLLKGQADVANAEVAAGAGIATSKLAVDALVEADAGSGLEVVTNTLHTKSDEEDFVVDLGAGDLACGASTAGMVAMNDADAMQYCDGEATPVRRVAAYGADDGDALAGDSATSFFDAGTIENTRGGTGADSSAFTGVARVASGTWTADAGISHLASSTSGDLLTVLSDEVGTGVAVFNINPTLTDVTVNDLITFTETAGDATCGAGDYWIKGNSTSNLLRGCENGGLFTLSTGTSPVSIVSPEAVVLTAGGEATLTGAADTISYHTLDSTGATGDDNWESVVCTAGSYHVILPLVGTRTVTVQASTLAAAIADFNLDGVKDRWSGHCSATNTIVEESRSNNEV